MKRRSICFRLEIPAVLLIAMTALRAEPGDLVGVLPTFRAPQDLAYDPADATFWITSFAESHILVLSDDLASELWTVPLPFAGRGLEISCATGIAYNSRSGTFLLVDGCRRQIHEVESNGSPTGLLIEIPADAGEGSILPRGLAFDAEGDGGRGSVYVTELESGLVKELTLAGSLVRSFLVPEQFLGKRIQPADIELIQDQGAVVGFYLAAQGDPSWILRLDREGRFTGAFAPLEAARGRVSGLQRRPFPHPETGEVLDAFLCLVESASGIAVFEAGEKAVLPLAGIECADGEVGVVLAWTIWQDYDAIEVSRDGDTLAALPGGATGFTDSDPPPGFHGYAVRGRRGGEAGDAAECSLWTGADVGAVLELFVPQSTPCTPFGCSFLDYPDQLARDPDDGSFYVTTHFFHDAPRPVYRFAADLEYLGDFPNNVELGYRSGIALRVTPQGERRLYSYVAHGAWEADLIAETLQGERLSVVPLEPPVPAAPRWFPTGLAWEPTTDTFFYLEPNSQTVVQIGPDGGVRRMFPHPKPPPTVFDRNFGLAVWAERGTLLLTTASGVEHEGGSWIDTIVEARLDGTLTGHEVVLDRAAYVQARKGFDLLGIFALGGEIIATAHTADALPLILRIQAFPDAPVEEAAFIRGDSNRDRRVDLSDPVHVLGYLFTGGAIPACLDAADGDDSGRLDLTDAVYVLGHLFLGTRPPPAPFPDEGSDPTTDALDCEAGP